MSSMSIELTRRALAHFDDDSLDVVDDTLRVSATEFTSDERFERDNAMMQAAPHVVGWGGEIPNANDFTTKDVAGTSIIINRAADGSVRAFVNACAHRGAEVAEGSGSTARFTCQYHAWSYDPAGVLVGLPGRDMFDPEAITDLGLVPLPAAEIAGLLVVRLNPAQTLDGVLDDVAAELSAYDYSRYAHAATETLNVAANWKFVVDVNFEGYHFPQLHKTTLAPFATNNSMIDIYGRHARWAFPFRAIEQLRDAPEDKWPERFTGTIVHFLFPSCVLVDSPSSPQLIRVYPGDAPGRSVVHISQGSFGPIESADQIERGRQGLAGALAVLRDEDFPAAENCQHGVENAIEQIIIGRNEGVLQHLHHTWDAFSN